MRLFRFRGGVHPEGHKELTEERPITQLPLPERLYVPVQQHIGAPAKPVVTAGDPVAKGALIATAQGALSASVHAPTSGRIAAIEEHPAPHPSGLPVPTIVIESDGEDRWADTLDSVDPFTLTPEAIAGRVAAAGIVGMGGATFPSAVKLNLGRTQPLATLIINGGECEPYLTCDDRLMREQAGTVVDGIRIMLHAAAIERALVGIEDNKPAALAAMRKAAQAFPGIDIVAVPSLYPMGSEKQMIYALTGREVPAGKRPGDIGVLVHNVATAHAVSRAVRTGRPLLSRVVTVSGGAVRDRHNLEVPIGTRVSELLRHCGVTGEPARLLMGGPMMGMVLPHAEVPVVKGSNGVIALTTAEVAPHAAMPCIRCGRCVGACPVGLVPLDLMSRVRGGDLDGAVDSGLVDCLSCGSCAYVCPAHLPLTQYFNFAKGELVIRDQERRKAEFTRTLAAERQERLERQRREKAAAMAARKAKKMAEQGADA